MITLERVTFRYPDAATLAVRDVSLTLPEGSITVVFGPSGAGKSTLLRCLNGLVPHFSGGTFAGRVRVAGLDPVQMGPEVMCRHVGFVFQDPETQFVMDRVEDEIAFGLENAAMPRAEMQTRVAEVLAALDLAHLRQRLLATLSGGEKQRVAIAAALALRPRVLILDEPTSQLDPQSAEEVLQVLERLNADLGLTVIVAEHRLERVLAFADHLIYLPEDRGRPVIGSPREVLQQVDLTPPVVALAKTLGWTPLPVTIEEGLPFARRAVATTSSPIMQARSEGEREPLDGILRVEALKVAYNSRSVLRDVSLALPQGTVTVLMGRNGAGKSTLLRTMVGLVRPEKGRVLLDGQETAPMTVAEICRQVAYLPQDPNALLFADTVREELDITLHNHGLSREMAPIAPHDLLARLGLQDKAEAYPRDLSVGERQRAALAAIMVTAPRVILLDEPTRGLDYVAKARLHALVRTWRADGLAVLLVTHDVELAAAVADRVLLMEDGMIVDRGAPPKVLGRSPLFAPQVARLFPGIGWLTIDDALAGLRPADERPRSSG